MRSYAVYDSETGEVVHFHVELADSEISREELLEMAALDRAGRLDVLEVPSGRMPAKPVRVEKGELREVDDDVGTGRGGGAERFPEPAVKQRYERVRPGGDEPSS
jgi:hypothetical protein